MLTNGLRQSCKIPSWEKQMLIIPTSGCMCVFNNWLSFFLFKPPPHAVFSTFVFIMSSKITVMHIPLETNCPFFELYLCVCVCVRMCLKTFWNLKKNPYGLHFINSFINRRQGFYLEFFFFFFHFWWHLLPFLKLACSSCWDRFSKFDRGSNPPLGLNTYTGIWCSLWRHKDWTG